MNQKTLKVLEYEKIKDMLYELAQSQLGKNLVGKIRPSNNMKKIEEWLEESDEALRLILQRGNPPLFGIHDIKFEIKRVEMDGSLSPGGLLKIADTLRVSRALKAYLKEDKSDRQSKYPIIQGLIDSLNSYKHIEDEITNAIISENEISDNASPSLRSIRRQIITKNQSVRDKLNSIVSSQENKKYLQDTIVTMREGRYVVPVKQENKGNIKGLVHDVSSSGATVFIEPLAVVELNNELRELEVKEREEIERILKELSLLVASESQRIYWNQKILEKLDFIFAKGKLGIKLNASKPSLNREGIVALKNARHPLLDEANIVPIDIYLGEDFNSLIITGPNTGGKTVTLKTLGLFTLMSQSGLHIPADHNSKVAIFDEVYADIGDEQSIEQSLSTFSSHMVNIIDILKNVSSNSLVLFDELGAGTDPTEGAALAISILDYLLNRKIRTVATTHYSQLKKYALTQDGVINGSVEFDIKTLRPTYRLLIGVPGKSNAFEISKRLGLEDYIIDYARELISEENIEFEQVLQEIERDRISIRESKERAERQKLEIEELKEKLQDEREKAKRSREEILTNARLEAKKLLDKAKEESELIISELRDVSSKLEKEDSKRIQDARDMLREQRDSLDKSLNRGIVPKKAKKPPKKLKIGDRVELVSLNQIGEVLSLPDESGELTVQIGIMKVNVNINTLNLLEDNSVQQSMKKAKKVISNKSKHVKSEIDLRGYNIEEAIVELDKYIDDCYIAGLKEVYVIHGKGTGALREGLKSYFRSHKLIKSNRIGNYGEGGTGVTVLEL